MRQRRRFTRSSSAVSDVLGSILLVSITVAVTGTLSVLVSKSMNPNGKVLADVLVGIEDGADGWGSGDETVWLLHRGGVALEQDLTAVHVKLNLGKSVFEGAALDGLFSDGRLSVGERWTTTVPMAACDFVQVWVVVGHDSGSSQLLADRSEVVDSAACGGP